MNVTPMMQQYLEAKGVCGDAILFFRMGDFYELFNDDAKTAARVLGMTLTSRDKGENATPMAGFPHHQLDNYLGKLIHLGYRVAICDQVENPKEAKGIVRREITRIVTPGTLTDDALLEPRESNYLAAVALPGKKETAAEVGVAWVEMSTGRFFSGVFPTARLADQLARIAPSECLVPEESNVVPTHLHESILMTYRPAWAFGKEGAGEVLKRHFETMTLEGFGFGDQDQLAVCAAGAVLEYLEETQRTSLLHIERLTPYRASSTLEIDEATRRSLELTRTMRDGRRDGSLLAAIDRCVTVMGSRLLGDWLSNPLTDLEEIHRRLDGVEELVLEPALARDLRESLKEVYDLERLLARVMTGRASPRDLGYICKTLERLPHIKAKITSRRSSMLRLLEERLDLCSEIRSQLAEALDDSLPLSPRDGGVICTGFNADLDHLRGLAAGGKQWIAEYQKQEIERTGIANLKVGFNKVFGYYLEVTNVNRERIPTDYIRKQTLKNAERYITPELKEYEEKVLSADEKAKDLEYELFGQLRDAVQLDAKRIQQTADVLANLDCLLSLAELARERNYCRPQVGESAVLRILDGRHPVLDLKEIEGGFVPNDAQLDSESGFIGLITGPNMAGKSTYIRQVALISLMAQMGSFVPAREADLGIVDRIFARVGASDELSRGQSTFMVEMTETARILNTATNRSLVILDEIGRGTSTYDGVSLAWSIVEYLHDKIGCRTLFATHYHELTDLRSSLPGVVNLNVAVKEWDDKVIFLHKIVPGAADKSYGIYVARLAGVPREVNERAKQILNQLESEHLDSGGNAKIASKKERRPKTDLQLSLFGPHEHPLLEKLREVDVDETTPLQALQLLQAWKKDLHDEGAPGG
ncbi:DNA mismatch repair protein MutS [Blastopirellula marina]|uniref:DNA mismatch repair protein MutS n=1 Tax=Blastopirellula marina DSM 3645 TaxID=314230 RepID=A3ZXE7_9BACT|nr:DNA mismatch repair protein MutS [Blastopirellula marina]EAQ78737.1 DNA mismatch repair protein [Blastopirellula marina DSM 3645]